jgi:hypothetical protein
MAAVKQGRTAAAARDRAARRLHAPVDGVALRANDQIGIGRNGHGDRSYVRAPTRRRPARHRRARRCPLSADFALAYNLTRSRPTDSGRGRGHSATARPTQQQRIMNSIIWLVGAVVIVLAVLSFVGIG